jgi:hypothetical protein
MNLNKIPFFGVMFIFLISFITHNMYEWFPSIFMMFFFPVNESIFEQQKMIFISYLLWGIVLYFILKKNNLYSWNATFCAVMGSLLNITFFLIIYLPIYLLFGHNLIVTLTIYFVSIMVTQYFTYQILISNKHYKKLNLLSFILIPIIIFSFSYFTFHPISNNILFDGTKNSIYSPKQVREIRRI